MRFQRSADPFPRKLTSWLTSSGEDDHRIVQLIAKTNNSPIFTYDGKNLTLDPQISTQYDTIFFRPHVFYGNNKHQAHTSSPKTVKIFPEINPFKLCEAHCCMEHFMLSACSLLIRTKGLIPLRGIKWWQDS